MTNWENVGDFAQGDHVMHIDADAVDPDSDSLPSSYWSYGEVDSDHYANFYLDPVLTYGDYSNTGMVGKANVQAFLEEYGDRPGVYSVRADYGSHFVAIALEVDDQEILETLSALADYPAMDTELISELEMEGEGEAWDDWARSDFVSELEKMYSLEEVDEIDDGKLVELFHEAQEEANEYWEAEGNGMWISVEKVAKKVDPDDLIKLGAVLEED